MVLPLPISSYKNLLRRYMNVCENFKMEIFDDVECQKCTLLAYREG